MKPKLHSKTCQWSVSRQGILVPCGKPSVALTIKTRVAYCLEHAPLAKKMFGALETARDDLFGEVM